MNTRHASARRLLACGLAFLSFATGAEVCPRLWWFNGVGWLEGAPGEPVSSTFASVQPVGQAVCQIFGAEFRDEAAPYGPYAILWTANGMQDVAIWCMKYYERHPYFGRPGWFQIGAYDVMLRYKQPNGQPGGYNTNCVPTDYTISLAGASRTQALPSGTPLPQTATVKQGGNAAANRSVTIRIGSSTPISGTTDGNGQFRFHYLPPYLRAAVEDISATCTGCTNTATKTITVEACEVCAP